MMTPDSASIVPILPCVGWDPTTTLPKVIPLGWLSLARTGTATGLPASVSITSSCAVGTVWPGPGVGPPVRSRRLSRFLDHERGTPDDAAGRRDDAWVQ